ncbi:MAG: helix-turn-helix transcriptional regulator, partial [Lentisphaeria bacterium]|nr:helix-turn-helix transcriptional regulator [Lentisphaeria bacterium]
NMLLASRKKRPEDQQNENILVQKTLRYIRDNYLDQNICLKNIANAVGISPSYLAAIFRRELKELTIGTYIAKLKFYRSMELLCSTNMSMTEIAKNCGYSNQFTFSRRFKQLHEAHFSPTKFRAVAKYGRIIHS